jgi:plasmid stabilization system protein ParE
MTEIRLAPEIAEDFERILDHLRAHEVADADARLDEILDAIDVLERHPLIGRPTADGPHELVIGRQSRGFVALYRYLPEVDTVFVLAIRNQKEAGYRDP